MSRQGFDSDVLTQNSSSRFFADVEKTKWKFNEDVMNQRVSCLEVTKFTRDIGKIAVQLDRELYAYYGLRVSNHYDLYIKVLSFTCIL